MITVSVRNISTVVKDADVIAAVAAVQTQVTRDFAPVWGCDAKLRFINAKTKSNESDWGMVIADNSDQAGALGYHDITKTGLPLGKVFAKTDIDAKSSWTNTLSHEVLEMLADPYINTCCFDDVNQRLWALEVGDPVEDDKFGYKINNILVSDFIYPAWFEAFRTSADRFDYMKILVAPFQIIDGGYMGYMDIGSGKGWQQINAELADDKDLLKARSNAGSRRERRATLTDRWVPSNSSLFIKTA